jgi:hypothetical protein
MTVPVLGFRTRHPVLAWSAAGLAVVLVLLVCRAITWTPWCCDTSPSARAHSLTARSVARSAREGVGAYAVR